VNPASVCNAIRYVPIQYTSVRHHVPVTETVSREHRGSVARVVLLAILGVLLAVNVYANVMGDQSYDAGGDCGGIGCMNVGTDRGYQIAFLLVALIGVVIAWPVFARRFRDDGESSSL